MTPATVVGHQEVLDRFAHWINQDRLASTYLFVGPDGIGKKVVATWLAKSLLCESTAANQLHACGECPACQQVDVRTHPDFLVVEKPSDKNYIPVDLLIGSREKRMREGLCHDIAMKPYRGGRRVAIIDDADFLNQEGANCLLKTLEEPPAAAVIFLIASSEHRQLPTIRSRSQIVRFLPLSPEEIERILVEKQLLTEGESARELSLACEGSLQLAMELADPETLEFRRAWLGQLASLDPGSEDFFESINSFVDAAGKDGAAKRKRMRLVAEMASWFYRHVLVSLCEQEIAVDETMFRNVSSAVERWPGNADSAAACIERCGEVREQVTANANQALIIETLLSDLGRIVRGEMLV